MSIPFSNTTQRIPRGFANLLEGLAREVLRNQPQDIPSFAAKYFENLLIEREKTGFDPTEWGAKLDDRYYNNRAFNELAPPGGGSQTGDKGEESAQPAAQAEEDKTEESDVKLTEEQAALKIQASYRGYKTRKEVKCSKEEEPEKEEPTEPDKKEPTEPDKKEPTEPDKKEPELAQ
ncbi:sperm surface protein Sp17 [Heteronotia binoei]|uniref:sperm surface protein Sp17 n=1 Tax=Heteronotia binoei TaxID=13085 RepID=UPI00292F14C8|nr:sperm surface protein Sp17 [Heteronotia binoei]